MVSKLKIAVEVITSRLNVHLVWINSRSRVAQNVFFSTEKVKYLLFANPKTFDGRIMSSE